MSVILIVEERGGDRETLARLLRSAGHDVYEASGSDEAERTLADLRPQLIIAGILMATSDGPTLVRRLRDRGTLGSTPVLFHAPTYHSREAWALAQTCGVGDVVTAPSSAEAVLTMVDHALNQPGHEAGAQGTQAAKAADHLKLVGQPLGPRPDRADMEQDRMAAAFDAAEQLAVQGYPLALLNKVCAEARRLTLAQYALVSLLPTDETKAPPVYACGLESEIPGALTAELSGVEASIAERRVVRSQNHDVRHPPGIASLLTVPIASPARVHGWLSLRNKLGAADFTEGDERVAVTLARQAGIAYENATHVEGLERRLSAFEMKLREAADRAERVREDERARLAHALHGQLGQSLTELRFDLYALAGSLDQSAGAAPEVAEKLRGMLLHVDETVLALRAMANELRPLVLDRLGLVAAIQSHADDIERRTGLRCRVDIGIGTVELDEATETSIFQIVQEALTNVQRHAAAGRVVITLKGSPLFFTVTVADNGRGISPAALTSSQSLGLAGMRERAALLGGTLDVERRRPSGTLIRLTLPAPGRRVEPRQPS